MASIFALALKMTESSCYPHFTVKTYIQFLSGNRFHKLGNSKVCGKSSLPLWTVMWATNFRLLTCRSTWFEFYWILIILSSFPASLTKRVPFSVKYAVAWDDGYILYLWFYCFFSPSAFPCAPPPPGYFAGAKQSDLCELHHYLLSRWDFYRCRAKILLEWWRDFCLPLNILAIDFMFELFFKTDPHDRCVRRWMRISGES